MFGQPNVEIIYPEPGFPIYESVINYTGAKAVPMILEDKTDFNVDIEKLKYLMKIKNVDRERINKYLEKFSSSWQKFLSIMARNIYSTM